MNTSDQLKYLSVEDIAARWHVSSNHVRRLIWRGELRQTRFGRAVRVALAEVERYENERAADGGDELACKRIGLNQSPSKIP